MRLFFFVFLLVVPPLVGLLITGQTLDRYLEFPPVTRYVDHADFSRPIFIAGSFLALFIVLFLFSFFLRQKTQPVQGRQFVFPWWGKAGLCLLLVSWILAWNRFPWFAPLQAWTFTPLWLGYILLVNGLSYIRKGSCLLLSWRRFALLFPVSALFWWYFEYLNRFVQNWYYVGIDAFSGLFYILHATLCFSTVLPAVLSTSELLATCSGLDRAFAYGPVVRSRLGSGAGWILSAGMGFVLTAISLYPDFLFPFVWIAPLLLYVGLQLVRGEHTIFSSLAHGDWRPILIPSLAALVCGFFWELWNWKSLARWQYSIPYVDRYHLFAMPLLGYLGYLPFGLECQVLAAGFMKDTPGHEQG